MVVWPIGLTHFLSVHGTPGRVCNKERQALPLTGETCHNAARKESLVSSLVTRDPASATVPELRSYRGMSE